MAAASIPEKMPMNALRLTRKKRRWWRRGVGGIVCPALPFRRAICRAHRRNRRRLWRRKLRARTASDRSKNLR